MGESSHSHSHNPSRLGLRNTTTVGEIVEVQGGHIVRSIGRKDRHSKVCTAKGPRDRRVRLAAHTAIQFYDVQDRLGYDRPSKAVDWLIKKAKAAIDELEQLPVWHPTTCIGIEEQQHQQLGFGTNISGSLRKRAMSMVEGRNEQQNGAHNSSFLPPSLDSDSIADTIKSFFPMGATSSAMQFQSFSNNPDLMSSHSQDLRLSLQSFQDPIMLHHTEQAQQVLLSGIPIGFDGATAWPEHHHPGGESGGGSGYLFNSPQPLLLGGHNQYFTQRGPLQSSNTPSVRADHIHNPAFVPIYPSSISGIGFHIPARIQGDEEEHDGYSDKPSSASSD